MLRIAVPIVASEMNQAVEDVQALKNEFKKLQNFYFQLRGDKEGFGDLILMYEWRADCIESRKVEISRFGRAAQGLDGVFTLRHLDEAGPNKKKFGFKGVEEERAELFWQAVRENFSYIDREINHWIHLDGLGDTASIASYHNFRGMLGRLDLLNLSDRMLNAGADICKFALTGLNREDNALMSSFISEFNTNYPRLGIIGIVMGEIGKDSRLDTRNHLTYAPLKLEGASANGQYTAEQTIEKLFQLCSDQPCD